MVYMTPHSYSDGSFEQYQKHSDNRSSVLGGYVVVALASGVL